MTGVSERVIEFGEERGLISDMTEDCGWAGAWRTDGWKEREL